MSRSECMTLRIGLIVVALSGARPLSAEVLRVPQDFPTIQGAVDVASPGDIIQVAPGVYKESVLITTSGITLMAAPGQGSPARAVLDGEFALPVAIQVEGTEADPVRDVVIRGFEVKRYDKGILLRHAVGCRLQLNEVHQIDNPAVSTTPAVMGYNGIELQNSRDNMILGNYVHDVGHDGILILSLPGLTDDGFNTVRANRIARSHPPAANGGHFGCGIQVNTPGNLIAENETTGNDWGILLFTTRSTDNVVAQNRVHFNHRAGIITWHLVGIDPADVGGNFIAQNNATGNGTLILAPTGTLDLFDRASLNNTWERNLGTFGSEG